jgi:hypothetical protein
MSESKRTSIARQRLGELNTFTLQRVHIDPYHGNESLKSWSFHGNESARSGSMEIEEIEGLKKVSSIQSAKKLSYGDG